MSDDRLRPIVTERFGDPDRIAAERTAPRTPPPSARRALTDVERRRIVLLDALHRPAQAA